MRCSLPGITISDQVKSGYGRDPRTVSRLPSTQIFRHSDIVFRMKPILLEMVNRLSEMGARLGALEAALVHTRQLTTGDIERLLGAHKANIESQLAELRTSIAALPE